MKRGSFRWLIRVDLICFVKQGMQKRHAIDAVAQKYGLESTRLVKDVWRKHISPQFRAMHKTGNFDKTLIY